MPNSKRKQEIIKVDLSGYTKKEIHEICETIKATMETSAGKLHTIPVKVSFPETKDSD